MSGISLLAAVQNGDIDPNAVNWANISGAHGSDQSNADQTIAGITRPIQLRASANNPAGWSAAGATLYYSKNGAAKVAITFNANFGPFSNNDTCHFVANGTSAMSVDTITIQNGITGTGSLDTFTVTLT